MIGNAKNWQARLLRVALGGALLLGGILLSSGVARADDWNRACQGKIRAEERELQRNIRRHGFYSRQANHDRRELQALRERCYRSGRWNGDGDRDDRRWGRRDRD
jgi:hypothetical protein